MSLSELPDALRTVVTFESASFNTSEARPHFINPCCYGDDLAHWMMARLRQAGVQAEGEPGQEDFGWYFDFAVAEGRHSCVLTYRPADESEPGRWIAWLERSRGFLGSLLGRRQRGIAAAAVASIQGVLAVAPEIANVRWHTRVDFDAGREKLGSPTP